MLLRSLIFETTNLEKNCSFIVIFHVGEQEVLREL